METQYFIMSIICFTSVTAILCNVFYRYGLSRAKAAPVEVLQKIEYVKKEELVRTMKFITDFKEAKKVVSEIRMKYDGVFEIDLIGDNGEKVTMLLHVGTLYDYINFSMKYAQSNNSKYTYDKNRNLYPLAFAEKIAEFTKQQLIPSTKNSKELVELYIKKNS